QKAERVKNNPEAPQWEKDLFRFIEEWLEPSEYIRIPTSGSTGTPKMMRVSKRAMLRSAFNTIAFFKLHPGHSALLCLSCKFIAGKMMVVRALAGGLHLITAPVSGHPLQNSGKPVDFAAMTPLQMSNELQQPNNFFPSIVILGGSPVSRQLSKDLQDCPSRIWETYGMTETLSHVALRPVNGPDASGFFQPLKEVRLSLDERHCLVIEAEGITTRPVVTNDMAELHENGRFRIKGRIDNIINTGGIKVVPEEIEKTIAPYMPAPFFVSSVSHPVLGQELVIITEKEIPEEEKFLEKLKKILPSYHAPRRILVKTPLPRTETGKIIRRLF
ncbi:MAG: AMP-binding protein, partial [Bacteroidota bacterium]